ncbi:unnamed protein product, partial [Dicrocoelium dendriticum]
MRHANRFDDRSLLGASIRHSGNYFSITVKQPFMKSSPSDLFHSRYSLGKFHLHFRPPTGYLPVRQNS